MTRDDDGPTVDAPGARVGRAVLLDGTIVLLACLVTYSFGITDAYFWDDEHLLAAAERVRSPLDAFSLRSLGLREVDGRISFWRPLATLSYALERAVFGPSAWAHRATNVVLHAANSLLALGFLRRRLSDPTRPEGRLLTLAVALLWATAPARAEVVSWISARPDLLGTFFVLGGAWLYSRATSAPARVALVALVTTLAMLSKEAYVFSAALLFLERRDPLSSRRVEFAAFLLVSLVYAAWRGLVVGIGGGGQSLVGSLPFGDRTFLVLETLGHAVDASFRPWSSVLFRGPIGLVPGDGLLLEPAMALLGLVGVALGTLLALRRPDSRGWLAALALVSLPVLNVVPTGIEARLCERYLYLPALVLYAGIPRFATLIDRSRTRLLGLSLGFAVLPIASLGAVRSAEFGAPLALLRGEVSSGHAPHSIYREAGFVFVEAGLYDEGLSAYLGAMKRREELGLSPPLADAVEALRLDLELASPESGAARAFLELSECLLQRAPRLVAVDLAGGARPLELSCADPLVANAIAPYLGLLSATRLTLAARAGLDVRADIEAAHARCAECTREHVELADAALALADPTLALLVLGSDTHLRFARGRTFAHRQRSLLAERSGDPRRLVAALFLGAAYRPACLAGRTAGSEGELVTVSCHLAGLGEKQATAASDPAHLDEYRSRPERRLSFVDERLPK